MINRPIPSTGELLPVIGLGTWQRFDVSVSDNEREPLRNVLKSMADADCKLIDSSPMYGKSEGVVGDLTTQLNIADKFFYATKVWTTGKQKGIDQMNNSFLKMKRSVMDLMQVHNLVDYKTHLETLRGWKEQGKIRYTGITHYQSSSHEQLEQIIRTERPDFVQFNYSIRVRNAEKRLLGVALDQGVAVLINEPLEKGSLFKLTRGKPLPDWAAEHNITTWTQFFLRFILAHPAVTCVIPATSDPAHMLENIKAGNGPLPDEPTRRKMIELIDDM